MTSTPLHIFIEMFKKCFREKLQNFTILHLPKFFMRYASNVHCSA